MSIDLKTIKHISKLSRISVDEKKAEKLAGDLNSIFNFIEKLNLDHQQAFQLFGHRLKFLIVLKYVLLF